jgi:hypothetical protein
MDGDTSSTAIAMRIRGLIGGQDRGMLEATARRLGVSEVALRMSVDDLAPHPTIDVLIAIVTEYGVDPTWLVTGVYDGATHRAAFEQEAAVSKQEIGQLIAKRLTPAESPQVLVTGPSLRLEA